MSGPFTTLADLPTAVPALLLPAALPPNPRSTPVPSPYAHSTPRAIRVRRSPR